MPGYKAKPPINASTLVLFRKRITMEMLQEVNERMLEERGIRLSGSKLGRPGKSHKVEKEIEYQDNKDRIEVERAFSLSKRCYGMGLIMEKLEGTHLTSIGISVLVTNLFKIYKDSFSVLILMIVNIRHKYRIYA